MASSGHYDAIYSNEFIKEIMSIVPSFLVD